MDIEIAVDSMKIADPVDQIVLFSGDGDFRSLVEAVQCRGVRVTVVSTISCNRPMIADELRRQADDFIDLLPLRSKPARDLSERPVTGERSHMFSSCKITRLNLCTKPLVPADGRTINRRSVLKSLPVFRLMR